ncbi:hypothetical protein Srut_03180 [Streptomyces rutgersensis]|nr:hypothetical protein Srut_03180 [Streptomyces rutgersensis]
MCLHADGTEQDQHGHQREGRDQGGERQGVRDGLQGLDEHACLLAGVGWGAVAVRTCRVVPGVRCCRRGCGEDRGRGRALFSGGRKLISGGWAWLWPPEEFVNGVNEIGARSR